MHLIVKKILFFFDANNKKLSLKQNKSVRSEIKSILPYIFFYMINSVGRTKNEHNNNHGIIMLFKNNTTNLLPFHKKRRMRSVQNEK
jgi:hypothetical protein